MFPDLARIDLGEVEYTAATTAMQGWVAECRVGTAGDRLFLLSHPPVVTYGPRTSPADPITSLRELAAERGVPTPTDAVVRDSLARSFRAVTCETAGRSTA